MTSSTPSDEFRETYYTGLDDCGRLFGTTDPCVHNHADWKPAQDGLQTVGKRLCYNLGDHPIVKHRDFLECRFEAILEELEVLSEEIQFVRIGDAPLADDELAVKVILILAPDQCSWDEGMSLVQRCRSEIQALGIDDVHCEAYEDFPVELLHK